MLSLAGLQDSARQRSISGSPATWEPPEKIHGKAQEQAERR
ncbi:MAG TPA: hypothetical protein VFR24_24720 [Candidatus Angelobacter sp.]|nr:hypothetical protein [Candidatus Angelobacter sp.]